MIVDDYLPPDPDTDSCPECGHADCICDTEPEIGDSCLNCGGLLTHEQSTPYCCDDCANEAERDSEEDE